MKVGYVRVSTVEQNLARQLELMKTLGVEKIYCDKMSGKNTERTEFKEMIEFLREGDTLYVESFSRLSRSTLDFLNTVSRLQAKSVNLVSDKEKMDMSTPQGKFMVTVFAALSELERTSMLERQREGIEIAKAEGADIMLWSIDSMDWSKRASIENMKTLISGQKLRGVFLFHDTHEQTIEALPEILDRLIADGCQFVTVSEYLAALRQDALPEGVNVAAPAIQENPHQPVPPQGTQAEREAPQQLFQPGDVHEVRQPMAPRPKAAETPGAEQMAGHSTNMNDAEPAALRTSML